MEQFAKSILNYFATYTETRFNFRKKIDYKWTDNTFTSDLSVFPDFQKNILSTIKEGISFNLSVKRALSSVSTIAWMGVPRIRTWYFSRTPERWSSKPQLRGRARSTGRFGTSCLPCTISIRKPSGSVNRTRWPPPGSFKSSIDEAPSSRLAASSSSALSTRKATPRNPGSPSTV